MLSIILPTLYIAFAAYFLWLISSAKHVTPITLEEAKVLWSIHRQKDNCRCRKWVPVTRRNGSVIGFKCECGYKYTQKKPVVSRAPKTVLATNGLKKPFQS
jgi:hypothetical protein